MADLWQTFRLRITTPRLQLRLPNDVELADLALLAGSGVHRPSEAPFPTPWTDGSAQDRAQFVLREHWGQLSAWAADDWRLGLGVFAETGEPLGVVTLRARDFGVVRERAPRLGYGCRTTGRESGPRHESAC